jgi:rhodanese-related sulfurtransferase
MLFGFKLRSITCGIRCLAFAGAVVFVAGAAALQPRPADDRADLAQLEQRLLDTYPHVRHVDPDHVATLAADTAAAITFDVRDAGEFEVSHIPGAIRVDPDIRSEAFLARFGDRLEGRTVVFYCSVGVRSSKLAGRLTEELRRRGASRIYNLSGGIFRWHNERRPLVDASGATRYVHPFDPHWGRYVSRRELTRMTPIPAH